MHKDFRFNCKSLALVLSQQLDEPRGNIDFELKEEEHEVFSLPCVTHLCARKIVFHLKSLPLCRFVSDWFEEETYEDILRYVAELEKTRSFDFNTVLALYVPSTRNTLFAFSPMHDVPAIDIKGKIKVSVMLPYES